MNSTPVTDRGFDVSERGVDRVRTHGWGLIVPAIDGSLIGVCTCGRGLSAPAETDDGVYEQTCPALEAETLLARRATLLAI